MPYKLLHTRIKISNNLNKLKYPVVLLRGLGRSMNFWLDFENELSKFCDIVFIDLLGTGGSKDFWGRASIQDFATDVLFTLKMNHINFFYLCGISLGGMVCLEITRLTKMEMWKELNVRSICIMASSSRKIYQKRIYIKPLILLFISIFSSFFLGAFTHKLFSPYLISSENRNFHNDIVNKWDLILKKEKFYYIPLFRQLFAAFMFQINIDFKVYNTPCLFIVSKHDKFVPWQNTINLWEQVPCAELIVLESLGHDLTTDDPILISQILYNFLKKI